MKRAPLPITQDWGALFFCSAPKDKKARLCSNTSGPEFELGDSSLLIQSPVTMIDNNSTGHMPSSFQPPPLEEDSTHPFIGRLEALEDRLIEAVSEQVETTSERLLEQYTGLKPLMSVDDVAKTLGVSKRTVDTIIAEGKLKPLWVRGQRRFHPDTIDAYIRRVAGGSSYE